MKNLRFVIYGVLFALVLIKSEAISWYRIYEMFHFQSFHMYGLLFSAIGTAAIGFYLANRTKENPTPVKPLQWKANLGGGMLFGLGWGITGACTAPLFILAIMYPASAIVAVVGALAGTYLYAFSKPYLPH